MDELENLPIRFQDAEQWYRVYAAAGERPAEDFKEGSKRLPRALNLSHTATFTGL